MEPQLGLCPHTHLFVCLSILMSSSNCKVLEQMQGRTSLLPHYTQRAWWHLGLCHLYVPLPHSFNECLLYTAILKVNPGPTGLTGLSRGQKGK